MPDAARRHASSSENRHRSASPRRGSRRPLKARHTRPSTPSQASAIGLVSAPRSEDRLTLNHDVIELGKILMVAMAVGLDTLAISVGVGVARLAPGSSLRLGLAFATAEIAMQAIGYELGAGAGQMLGRIASFAGFILLAIIGFMMLRKALQT